MAPEPRRAATRALLLAALTLVLAAPAHALRVATYNVLDYRVSNLASRQASFRTVMAGLNADVLIAQELNEAAAKDSFLTNVLNVVNPGEWTGSWMQLGTEGGAIFWRPAKVNLTNFTSVATGGPRPVLLGIVKPVGYVNNAAWFRLYSVHFKAGTPLASTTDSTTRRVECTSLRTTVNSQFAACPNFVLGGDTNFYGSWEGGYQRLTESQTNNNGRGIDPNPLSGTWNDPAYALYHTQSPRASSGGMDDRFDLFLTGAATQDGAGLDLIPGTYIAYGNDGLHFNDDIDGGGLNTAVGLVIAAALRVASDHVPALLQLQLPARIAAGSQLAFGDAIVGAAGVTLPLSVSNPAVAPADVLTYSLAAPAGFTAPGGPFTRAAGAPANTHDVGLDASTVGVKAGTLTVSTNAPDSVAKPVQLSARVLAHAVASLDSAAVVTAGSLDFGTHLAGEFADRGLRVHDQGWTSLQAQLAVSGANVTGGDGRFSLVGFAPATFGAIGRTFAVHFDDTGATLDSTYDATLTFTTADEALPGGTAGSTLTVDLHAQVASHTGGVGTPHVLRLSPPRPNPMHAGTDVAFELPHAAPVELAIFDLGGRRVATLADGILGEGHHTLRWNAQNDAGRRVSAGLYFIRFTTPGLSRVQRVALLP